MTSSVPEFPSRRGLILGSAIVALYGLQQEFGLQARHFGIADPSKHYEYAACKAAITALKGNQPFATDLTSIHDRLVHTRQTLRISLEEWEACVPVTVVTPRDSSDTTR